MDVVEVSEACQINDLDHPSDVRAHCMLVSEACQINDLDHMVCERDPVDGVSEACQINDLDHRLALKPFQAAGFRSLSDQ